MTEAGFYTVLFWIWLGLAPLTFCLLLFVPAPYGRNLRDGWGPKLPFLSGWILMEFAAPVGMLVWYLLGNTRALVPTLFLGLWLLHYLHRSFLYAWIRRDRGSPIPLTIGLSALSFNLTNTYLIGRELFAFSPMEDSAWLSDPRFLGGLLCFVVGFAINLRADHVLLHLRKPGETGYKIPHGGLFQRVSCPNYLGELIEWCGWALLTWSLSGVLFALWTAANLVPRAITHHRWYQETFSEYPSERKALIPWIL